MAVGPGASSSASPTASPIASPIAAGDGVGVSARENQSDKTISQVRLRIVGSKPASGAESVSRLVWISPGQSLTVGRSTRCDFWLEGDPFLSSAHFQLTCERELCQLQDLQSSSGTWLNGKRIERESIFDGDLIVAGRTDFHVEIDGAEGPMRRDPSQVVQAAEAKPKPTSVNISQNSPLTLVSEKCSSGLWVLQGLDFGNQPMDRLIEMLRPLGSIYLLIDLSRCDFSAPQNINPASRQLFLWLPDESAARSPHLFNIDELVEWQKLVPELIGNEALVVLVSKSDAESLIDFLRSQLQADVAGQQKNPSRGMLGFCWPSVMEACLESGAKGFSASLFQQVSLVLVESDNGTCCRLFAAEPKPFEQLVTQLRRLGTDVFIDGSDN
jgi:pSer/pThr/pTyr-binding forkhead associated (FHA) protein